MDESSSPANSKASLPPIPAKRYFTIGEVSELCGVKPHVLRYWEQEFPQLKPVKRRGNRRYYQRQDVIVIRQIRSLLYEQGFTISGARHRLIRVPVTSAKTAGEPKTERHVTAQRDQERTRLAGLAVRGRRRRHL
jgi:DNA-binding transcriptional MerR regulator